MEPLASMMTGLLVRDDTPWYGQRQSFSAGWYEAEDKAPDCRAVSVEKYRLTLGHLN